MPQGLKSLSERQCHQRMPFRIDDEQHDNILDEIEWRNEIEFDRNIDIDDDEDDWNSLL